MSDNHECVPCVSRFEEFGIYALCCVCYPHKGCDLYKIAFCESCGVMTNHLDGICQKSTHSSTRSATGVTPRPIAISQTEYVKMAQDVQRIVTSDENNKGTVMGASLPRDMDDHNIELEAILSGIYGSNVLDEAYASPSASLTKGMARRFIENLISECKPKPDSVDIQQGDVNDSDELADIFVKLNRWYRRINNDVSVGGEEELSHSDALAAVRQLVHEAQTLDQAERAELESYRKQRAISLEDYHEFGKAPVDSPERLAAYVSYLSLWNLRNGVEALREWKEAAEVRARIDELKSLPFGDQEYGCMNCAATLIVSDRLAILAAESKQTKEQSDE